MSIKSNLAKAVPVRIAKATAGDGNHNGIAWSEVIAVMNRMCETKEDGDRKEYIYEGKVVGWTKPVPEHLRDKIGGYPFYGWCDETAWVDIKKAYDALPQPEEDEDGEYDEEYEPEYDDEEESDEEDPNYDNFQANNEGFQPYI